MHNIARTIGTLKSFDIIHATFSMGIGGIVMNEMIILAHVKKKVLH